MYQPSDDSFLLAACVRQYTGDTALEIGVGSGAVLEVLYKNFKTVIGTDISFSALAYCKGILPNVLLACSDAASIFRSKFDLIVSNPPYLPNEGYQEKDCTIDGGITGMETTIHFIKSAVLALAQSGKILVVTSTLSYSPKIDEIIREMKLKKRTIAEKKLFFETLLVDEISFKD